MKEDWGTAGIEGRKREGEERDQERGNLGWGEFER